MSSRKRRNVVAHLSAVLLALFLGASALWAQDMTLELDPAHTQIEFTLGATLHTVHGAFALKSGTIRFDPSTGLVSGLVVVDAQSGDSGNKGRDRKMHKEILESQRYPEVTFSPTKLSGTLAPQGDSKVQVEGIFKLHGAEHPATLTMLLQLTGNSATARTQMVVPYLAWGLKNPSTFFLHVSDKVEVDINATGHLVSQAGK